MIAVSATWSAGMVAGHAEFAVDGAVDSGERRPVKGSLLTKFSRVIAGCAFVALASCKSTPPPPAELEVVAAENEAEPPPAPVVLDIGRIALIGAGARFVVIELATGVGAPATGTELGAWFLGQDVARLRVSPERKGRMVTADVIRGRVDIGYEVRQLPE